MSTQRMPAREEYRVDTNILITKLKELINEGNVQRIIVRDGEGKTLFNVPLTMAIAGGAAAIFLAPPLAALATIAALMKQVTIAVERTEE